MTITLSLPADIVQLLTENGEDISRTALESLASQEYRLGRLSEEQVRRMLGFESRFDVHAFLKAHDTHLNYTDADLEQDLATALERSSR
ncbi:MAG: UPF0175 family protein [Candidatus Solibacter sp.]|jgi:hypothetical protein